MIRRTVPGLVVLALLIAALAAPGQDKSKTKPDEKKPAEKTKYEPRGLEAKINKVDVAKNLITVKGESGKTVELKVTDDTKFFGPRGGVSKEGIKDDRVAVGNTIHYYMGKDGKKLEEIHLPVRKSGSDEKKPEKK